MTTRGDEERYGRILRRISTPMGGGTACHVLPQLLADTRKLLADSWPTV